MPCKRCGIEIHTCNNYCIEKIGFCCECVIRMQVMKEVRAILKEIIYQAGDVYIDARTLDSALNRITKPPASARS